MGDADRVGPSIEAVDGEVERASDGVQQTAHEDDESTAEAVDGAGYRGPNEDRDQGRSAEQDADAELGRAEGAEEARQMERHPKRQVVKAARERHEQERGREKRLPAHAATIRGPPSRPMNALAPPGSCV